jgi:hypothetical protein
MTMPKLSRVATIVAAGVLGAAVLVTAQPKDPFVGTWVLDVTKSKYSPGPAPKSATTVVEAAGQGYKFSVKQEFASGVQQWSFTTNLDGKEVPVTGNNPNADMIAVKRVDANTLETVAKKGGKVTTTQKNVVAADGKSRTVTTAGTNAQGEKVNNVAVYERK